MNRENQSGSRTDLEWVSCPSCSTTFRVAVPSHFERLYIVEDEDDIGEDSYYQRVSCVNDNCDMEFYVELIT